jgi:hypothetical protein
LVLALATIVLCYLALNRDTDVPPDAGGPGAGDPSVAADPNTPPPVEDQVRVDFASTTDLPEGSRTYDTPSSGSPLQVRDGALTHDVPKAGAAIGSLEMRLDDPVQKLGARVVFPAGRVGSVNLVAWTKSLVEAQLVGQSVPTSGLRLEASVTDWQLTVYDDGDSVIAGNVFTPGDGPLTFEVYRSGSRAWVVDPTGKVTMVDNPAIGELEGPWACWQLTEQSTKDTPAQILELWAG